MVVLYILIFILVLGIVVCFHEFGHFMFAKKFNVLVNEFAFGMGPRLLAKKKGETVYSLRAFPIGGFCAMSGESDSNPPLKIGEEVRLLFDKDGRVEKIVYMPKKDAPQMDFGDGLDKQTITPKKVKKVKVDPYKDLAVYKIDKFDLWGKDMSPLYINDFEVRRDAMLVYSVSKEMQIAPEERDFSSKKVYQRFLIAFGGPMNNIILALFVFLLMSFIVGVGSNSNIIGKVSDNSPASMAGLVDDDKIVKIDDINIDSFTEIGDAIDSGNRVLSVTVDRGGTEHVFNVESLYGFNNLGISSLVGSKEVVSIVVESEAALGGTNKTFAYQEGGLRNKDIIKSIVYNDVTYEINSWNDLARIANDVIDGGTVVINYTREGVEGIQASSSYKVYSDELLNSQKHEVVQKIIGVSAKTEIRFFECILNGLKSFWSAATIIFSTLGLLLTSKEVGIKDMGGFITILNQTASYAAGGFTNLLYFVGLLSVNLAIINLLPIPALDGGRIVFLAVEGIFKKKVNPKVETIIENIVFWLLMAFIVYVLFQDIIRLVIQLQ